MYDGLVSRRLALLFVTAVLGCSSSHSGDDAFPLFDGGAFPKSLPSSGDEAPGASIRVFLPIDVPRGRPFPVILDSGRFAAEAQAAVDVQVRSAGNATPAASATLRYGRASVSLGVERSLDLLVNLGHDVWTVPVRVTERPRRALAGPLVGPALRWSSAEEIVLDATVSVPEGETLVIDPGARVLAGPGVNLDVLGILRAAGTSTDPILFTRDRDEPWGGVHLHPGATATLEHVLLTAGGGDGSRVFGHSGSQPVVFADTGATLTITGGGIIDNPGKGPSSRGATVTITNLLVSRCDTGGEHDESELRIAGSHYLEFPDADGVLDDDDNDALYLSSGAPGRAGARAVLITETVFAIGEDDGIDHAGALVELRGVRISSMANEGIAASNGGRIVVKDTMVRRCAQGIEAGWGAPEVVVENSLLVENRVGLRFGDEYPNPSEGSLVARFVAVAESYEDPVRNLWSGAPDGPRPRPGAIDISCSLVGSPEWDGRNGNGTATPRLDRSGCLELGLRSLASCPQGPVGPRNCP